MIGGRFCEYVQAGSRLPKKRRLRAVSRHHGSPHSQKADLGGPERTSGGTITNYIIFIKTSFVGRKKLLVRETG